MDFYNIIETARKTGKIDKGVNEVTKAIELGSAKLVVYAADVNPKEITAHLAGLCKEKGIKCAEVDSKQKLGIAAGIGAENEFERDKFPLILDRELDSTE